MGSTMALSLNIAFAVVLVIGFLIGLWRGFKKASVNLAFSIVGILIAFFLTPLITNMTLSVTITINGVSQPLSQFVYELLASNADLSQMANASPNIEVLLNKLPAALVGTLVFIVLTLIIELFIYIIYKIIAVIFLKNKPGKKRHRLLGGAVGTVRAFLLSIFAFAPLASLIGLANEIAQPQDVFVTAELAEDYSGEIDDNADGDQTIVAIEENLVLDTFKALDKTAFCAIGGVFGLDNAMFDYLSKVKIDGENLYIRQEASAYISAYSAYNSLQQGINKNKKFASIDFEKLEGIVENVLDSKLFSKIVCDLAADVIINYNDYSFAQSLAEYSDILDDIGEGLNQIEDKSSYFSNDIKQIFNAFKNLAESGVIDNVKDQMNESEEETSGLSLELIKLLTTDNNFEGTSKAVENIFSMNMIRNSAATVTNFMLDKVITGLDKAEANTSDFTEQDWKNLSAQISSLLKDASALVDSVDIQEVLSSPANLINPEDQTDLTNTLTLLGKTIDDVRAIEILKNNQGKSVIDKLLEDNNFALPTQEVKDAQGNVVLVTNYAQMFAFLSSSLEEVKKINIYQFVQGGQEFTAADVLKLLANESQKQPQGQQDLYLGKLLLPLSQIDFTEDLVFGLLDDISDPNLVDFSSINTYDLRKADLRYINQLIIALNQPHANSTLIDELLNAGNDGAAKVLLQEDVDLEAILKPILYANSTISLRSQLFAAIDSASRQLGKGNETIDETKLILIEGHPDDQAQQVCDIIISMAKFYNTIENTTNMIDMNSEALGAFLDEIRDSVLESEEFKEIINPVFEMLTKQLESEFDLNTKGIDINEYIQNTDKSFVELINQAKDALNRG